jgi:hypothetical protein
MPALNLVLSASVPPLLSVQQLNAKLATRQFRRLNLSLQMFKQASRRPNRFSIRRKIKLPITKRKLLQKTTLNSKRLR